MKTRTICLFLIIALASCNQKVKIDRLVTEDFELVKSKLPEDASAFYQKFENCLKIDTEEYEGYAMCRHSIDTLKSYGPKQVEGASKIEIVAINGSNNSKNKQEEYNWVNDMFLVRTNHVDNKYLYSFGQFFNQYSLEFTINDSSISTLKFEEWYKEDNVLTFNKKDDPSNTLEHHLKSKKLI